MEEAEKAYKLAEDRFLAGDITGALRLARSAKRLFDLLPALASAAVAYEVHAAARGGSNWCAVLGSNYHWYAVLGLPAGAATHDAIKKQYRRLCLALHPDKNPSAAADGAFKLLQQAWQALSARHPPGPADAETKPSGAQAPPPTYAEPPPTPAPTSSAKPASDSSRPQPPPPPPPPPFDFKACRERYPRGKGTIYCGHCNSEPGAGGGVNGDRQSGERCHACGAPVSPPRHSRAEATASPPSPPPPPREEARAPRPPGNDGEARRRRNGGGRFTCPVECPRCGARLSGLVSVGVSGLTCQTCDFDAIVYVRSRRKATAF